MLTPQSGRPQAAVLKRVMLLGAETTRRSDHTERVQARAIGVLMLESRFPRPYGDMGVSSTWPFPVLYRVVPRASPHAVVRSGAAGLLPAFIAAGRELVAAGAIGLTTSCGFLTLFQTALAEATGVPVAASSLSQVTPINALLPPGRRCGVLTIAASALSYAHLDAANVPYDTPIGTTEGGRVFTQAILGDAPTLDLDAACADNVAAACALVRAHPEIGALVLECSNMTPYARAIHDATGLPVFTVVDFITWFWHGLNPRRYLD